MGVDRLMVDTNGMSFECKLPGNLFGGPAFFQLGDNGLPKLGKTDQLPPPHTPSFSFPLCNYTVLTTETRQLAIGVKVRLYVAINC